jgi:hypothetical protein
VSESVQRVVRFVLGVVRLFLAQSGSLCSKNSLAASVQRFERLPLNYSAAYQVRLVDLLERLV